MRVVPVPILPKPQQHSSHRLPLMPRPIPPELQQRRHWMICSSRTIPITENQAKVIRKVLKNRYISFVGFVHDDFKPVFFILDYQTTMCGFK